MVGLRKLCTAHSLDITDAHCPEHFHSNGPSLHLVAKPMLLCLNIMK